MEKRLLIITKANSRSTVHRSAYLDYIGFKIFDADGNVVGERRFLGLFSLGRVPDLGAGTAGGPAQGGRGDGPLRAEPAQPLRQGPDGDPGGLPARRAVPDRHRRPVPHGDGRAAPGRPPAAAAVRPQGPVRPVHLLPGLPAPGPVHHGQPAADPGDPAARAQRRRASTTPPGSPTSMLARIHFIVRTDPAARLGEIDADDAVRAARRRRPGCWDDDFRPRAGAASSATSRPAGCSTRYGDALPETYKDAHTPYEAVQDLAKLELLDEPGQLVLHLFRRRKNDDDVRFKVFRYGEPMMLSAVLPVLHSLGVRVDRRAAVRGAPRGRHRLPLRLRADAAARRPRPGRGAGQRGERVLRRLARRGRGGRLQRAGAAGRPDLAAGGGAAGVREVPAPGRHRLLAGVHGGDLHRVPARSPRCWWRCSRPGSTRRSGSPTRTARPQAKELVERIRRQLDEVACLDQDRILRSYLTLIQATLRTSFFQRGDRRAAQVRTWRSSSTRRRSRTCRRRGPGSRSSSTRPGSRACTCASARSPAAACAGRTGGRTSAPRCSAWSRRRW